MPRLAALHLPLNEREETNMANTYGKKLYGVRIARRTRGFGRRSMADGGPPISM